MTRRDDALTLRQMLEYAQEAIELTRGKSRSDVESDRVLCLAIVRLLEIIGEAAGRVSSRTQRKNPQIPWGEIVGLRNRLIHGYDSVDIRVVWEVLVSDLPDLVKDLEKLVQPDSHG